MPGYVYLLWHNGPHFEETGDTDQSKLLGVFSSEDEAAKWRDEAKSLPGFSSEPAGFLISRCALDRREWTTGFLPA
jgi:hypothetical protein